MELDFRKTVVGVNCFFTARSSLTTLQINVGNRCNQHCIHCHIDAGPNGSRIMSVPIFKRIADFLKKKPGLTVDITGGCPELNPHFRKFIENASPYVSKIIVRNNLSVLLETGMEDLPNFYCRYGVVLNCSMPCYTKENVDTQRGVGVFEKSITALCLLNEVGYGTKKNLELNLVYNPGGVFLPVNQVLLERDYKRTLSTKYGITFNRLLTITNAPINRFKRYLKANGKFEEYMSLLMRSFNPGIVGDIMCHSQISVGWDGTLYDCDFNLALGMPLCDKTGAPLNIQSLGNSALVGREILFGNHCYCCTAGNGSSCSGALKKRRDTHARKRTS